MIGVVLYLGWKYWKQIDEEEAEIFKLKQVKLLREKNLRFYKGEVRPRSFTS